jgi:hypothetical protein
MPENPDDMVLTPGGYRRRSLVHRVEPGQAVRGQGEGSASVVATKTERNPQMANDLVLTPGGYRHRSLVHRVEPGHAVHHSDGKIQLKNLATGVTVDVQRPALLPGDVPGFGSGWIADAFWMNTTGSPVTSFQTTWTVPPAPATDHGQTIFLFNGIDPSDPSQAILQPVLQWGPSHAGGGSYWTIASWYVTSSGDAFFTPLVNVNPGDTLVGVMTLTAQGGGLFSYQSAFQGISGTVLPVENVAELVWCNETLEAYGITTCSDYPATDLTAMDSIEIQTGSTTPAVHWTPQDRVTDCHQHATVPIDSGDGGEVYLYYRNPSFNIPWQRYLQYIEILFGVIQGGGGIGIVGGHIVIIPPRGPEYRLFTEVAAGLGEVTRGFEVMQAMQGSGVAAARSTIDKAGLELMLRGLENSAAAVRRALQSNQEE